ncbi:Phage integrase family protein [Sporobacter termitidis DSM 10068]|uniref:Phage integrase family protein n=1 Tax=Sporobacter termitidis DSM 10068 TaxID=1123282 RepID=A0A1M5U1J3_9FIRM|nr:site-specific integrase [Sporobacter termitidis]SHH56907.1 Phage integrase family protein [Sporobacter termitidis DSM 10068]
MASIVKRNKSYAVVYGYKDLGGNYKRKWETYRTEEMAQKRKQEIEDPILFLNEHLKTSKFNDLLNEYIELHGLRKWSASTYSDHTMLMDNYIRPILGEVSLARMDKYLMNKYFRALSDTPSVGRKTAAQQGYVTEITIFEVYKLLRSVFQQAVHWGYFNENLVAHMGLKPPKYAPRKTLSSDQVALVINSAIDREDFILALSVQLAFSCSMRRGELLGLCWNDIDFENSCIHITRELARVSNNAIEVLKHKDIYRIIEPRKTENKSRLVLKRPKTDSSIRTVYMPAYVSKLLSLWGEQQRIYKLRGNYHEYDLVLSGINGNPICPKQCNERFKRLLKEMGFPKAVFHSLRHSSTSYKLVLSNGNIKAVQGDNGHAQADMVLSVYAQINDAERKNLAHEMESSFGTKLNV